MYPDVEDSRPKKRSKEVYPEDSRPMRYRADSRPTDKKTRNPTMRHSLDPHNENLDPPIRKPESVVYYLVFVCFRGDPDCAVGSEKEEKMMNAVMNELGFRRPLYHSESPMTQ